MENEKKITLKNFEPKKASEENVTAANKILKLDTLKKFVDAFMSSVNKSTKKGVKEVADKLINACINVAEKLDENIDGENKIKLNAENGISDENVKKFNAAYSTVLKDLSESPDKKEKKLATSMSNAFPHWCLKLAQALQNSNFYKRLSSTENKNTDKDNGTAFDAAKKENNKGVMYELKKKYKNLFSGKARKHETFNKIKNLVVRYSEPWAIAWVNAAGDKDPISESSAIKEINNLCKRGDAIFITDLGDGGKFKLAGSFNSIFGTNFVNNSGKIKKSLKSIIDRLVSISKKLGKEKYNDEDKNTISAKIQAYNKDTVFKEVMDEPGILSKVWGKLTAAASTVGKEIKTAGGKVVDGAKAVGSGIAKLPKHLKSDIKKIYDKLKKIFPQKGKMNKIIEEIDLDNKDDKNLKNIQKSLDIIINNNNLNNKEKQKIISNNTENLDDTSKFNESMNSSKNDDEEE